MKHAERDANGNREGHGDDDEGQMSDGSFEDFGAMLEEKCPGSHACAPRSGGETCGKGMHFGVIDAGKFLRRAVSDNSAIFEEDDSRGEQEVLREDRG